MVEVTEWIAVPVAAAARLDMYDHTLPDIVQRLASVESALERLTAAVDRLTVTSGGSGSSTEPVPPSAAPKRYVCHRAGCGRAQNKRLSYCCSNCSRNEGHSQVCDNAAAQAGDEVEFNKSSRPSTSGTKPK